jgi:NADPH:quinone reductase-like Zn-dependent oxidoreductase
MKAVLLTAHGGPDKLVYGDAPDPAAGPGEIVVDVHAASVNAADYKVRLGGGAYSGASNLKFPYILGRDFSGIVSALGAGVDDLKIGDAVFGVMDAGIEGCYAEKVKIKSALVAKKPEKLGHAEAAAMALTSLTAIWALEDTARLQRGEMVLIQGGAGGVAGFAIQLAKHIGARVITTTSAANVDYVRGLGADEVIDYGKQDFTKVVSGVDAVFETVGGDVAMRSFAVLKAGGRAAFIASGGQAPKSPRDDVASLRPAVGRTRRHMERVAQLYLSGAVRPPEIKLYKLSEVAAAQRVSEGRHFRGKLVFEVR